MELVRHTRNVVIIAAMVVGLFGGCFYLSGLMFFVTEYGAQYLTFDFLKTLNPLWSFFDSWSKWWHFTGCTSSPNYPNCLADPKFAPYLIDSRYVVWLNPNNPQYVANVAQYAQSLFYFPKDHYVLRLVVCTLVPILVFSIIGFLFRAPILDWRPFKKKESVHGDAKWADEKAIKKAGLREKKGMLIGKDKKGFLIVGGYQHALLFAPTGSGKGVGFVIPNLLFWEDSVVVHDIKLENYELTSGYRKEKLGQKVFVWNPADPDGVSHCYNPLDWISSKPGQMVDDVQKIANLILPEQEFWNNEARSLFVGVVLYLLAVPEKIKSFGEVVRTLRSDDVVYNLAVVLDTIGKVIHPVAYMNIAAFLQKADKERSGVVSTLNSSLELWANPLIDTATASSDFNVMTFKKELTTVYVGLTPDNLTRLQPLMQVFYQQSTEFLCRKMPTKDDPYGVMFMMDEFPTLGDMEQFKTGIAYFRGYHVRLFLIIQDTEQLKGIYEEAGMNSFLSNSAYRVTFAANNMETANLISQLVGNKTADQESVNKPKFLDLNPASRSLHVSEVARALLLPQEVIQLPRDEQIILVESSPPIKTKKIFYYKDKYFTKRLLPPIEVPTQEPYDPRKQDNVGPTGSLGDQADQPPPPSEELPPPPMPEDLPLPPLPDENPPEGGGENYLPDLPPLPDEKQEEPSAGLPDFDLPYPDELPTEQPESEPEPATEETDEPLPYEYSEEVPPYGLAPEAYELDDDDDDDDDDYDDDEDEEYSSYEDDLPSTSSALEENATPTEEDDEDVLPEEPVAPEPEISEEPGPTPEVPIEPEIEPTTPDLPEEPIEEPFEEPTPEVPSEPVSEEVPPTAEDKLEEPEASEEPELPQEEASEEPKDDDNIDDLLSDFPAPPPPGENKE